MAVIRPSPKENKTTIQIDRSIKEALTTLGLKGESYNQIILRLLKGREKDSPLPKLTPQERPIQLTKGRIILSKHERVIISIESHILILPVSHHLDYGPPFVLEISYNKPLNKEDIYYQIDLKIEKIIFDNEVYSPKEFFGVLQKNISYSSDFVYFYLRSVLKVIHLEFKKSNYFFKEYSDFFDISRWRTFLLNSKLSPEILSSDVESILADLKNERTNNNLIEDVKNSYYSQLQINGRF